MSWITAIWSATAGVCLTLAGVHFLVWVKSRASWANLLFSIAAGSAAACAGFELALMHAQTPAQFGELLRWLHVPVAVMAVSVLWFVRQYLQAGRLWLAWLYCVLRAVTLILTFSLNPNLNFREITGLHSISAWGETIVSPIGVKNPWTNITHASVVVLLVFVVDAATTAWRQGLRQRAFVVGVTFVMGIIVAVSFSELMNRGGAPVPVTISLPFLIIILGMAYELSMDVLNANRLTRELRESQERMILATKAANLGLWEWDVIRDEIWVSDAIRSRIGLGEAKRLDLDRILQSLHPDDRAKTLQTVRRALEDGNEFEAEYRSISVSGESRWFVARGQVERGSDGKPLRIRGVSVDITERKQGEIELQKLQSELAHIQRVSATGQLATTLAHELNQPLGAILRNAEAAELFLKQNPPDVEEVQAILADIKRDDQRAGAVIDRVRMLLKRRVVEFEPLVLKQLVDQVATLLHAEIQMHHVTLEIDVPAAIPAVRGDRVQLQQLLLNLLLNGLDALAGQSPERLQLRVRARRLDDHFVEVAVMDRGTGIPTEQLARIFDPFVTTKANGLGMGLSICQTIIAIHEGSIWAENNPDGGAIFRFKLPTADERVTK